MKLKMALLATGILLANFYETSAQNSIFNSGAWYKITVTEDGVYRLSHSDLQSLGIDAGNINPKNIQMYGNGGGMLPEDNAIPRPSQPLEIAIEVNGEDDGSFDSQDYILFYGQSQNRWSFNAGDGRYHHQVNYYSDTTTYFITVGNVAGKRITLQPNSVSAATNTVSYFDQLWYSEKEDTNLISSGKNWLGERLKQGEPVEYQLNFPNLEPNAKLYLNTEAVVASTDPNTVEVSLKSTAVGQINAGTISGVYWQEQAESGSLNTEISLGSNDLNGAMLSFSYSSTDTKSKAWVNFVELNMRQALNYQSKQLIFKDKESVGANKVTAFFVSNTDAITRIWDVSDHQKVLYQAKEVRADDTLEFRIKTDSLHEFIAFDESNYKKPGLGGVVPNQNLISVKDIDMIIVAPEEFASEASRLAAFRSQANGLTSMVVSPEEIYNEFSSGEQDIVAIRDFVRSVKSNSSDPEKLKYLLLFGRGSYDYKDRVPDNTNWIPTYQSFESFSPTRSYSSDDFFGLLGAQESNGLGEGMDIAIGRLPVSSVTESKAVVDKLINYENSKGKWKSLISFIADDEDANLHLDQADQLTEQVDMECKYEIEKIYFDAFEQQSDTSGDSYPEVKAAIEDRFSQGALIINYTGHGGESGLAHERVLDTTIISKVDNADNLPVLFCATASIGRTDDPEVQSLVQSLLNLNEDGIIGAVSASRLVFASPNHTLNKGFYKELFELENGKYQTLGQIVMNSTNSAAVSGGGATSNHRSFSLLGDPSMHLALPEHFVNTVLIDGTDASLWQDTLRSGESVNIDGAVFDSGGNIVTDFNGSVCVVVYDKKTVDTTLANDGGSTRTYLQWNDTIFFDTIDVVNGLFDFQLTVPIDIQELVGTGRIHYYAWSDSTDASGCKDSLLLGDLLASTDLRFPEKLKVTIYPMPITDRAIINVEGQIRGTLNLRLYDATGRLVEERGGISERQISLAKNQLSEGLYLLHLEAPEEGRIFNGHIIIQ